MDLASVQTLSLGGQPPLLMKILDVRAPRQQKQQMVTDVLAMDVHGQEVLMC